jgi:hypothetical protein
MRLHKILLTLLVFAVVLGVGFTVLSTRQNVQAQDEMAMVVCDADLILNLYVAEYYFNFAYVMDAVAMSEGGAAMALDLSVFDKGQYAALFDSMMGMMDESMMMSGGALSEELLMTIAGLMAMDDETLMTTMMEMMPETDMSAMTTLAPAAVEGEAAECTALRTTLNRFFTIVAYENLMMASTDM